jgi:hypothetical protein
LPSGVPAAVPSWPKATLMVVIDNPDR